MTQGAKSFKNRRFSASSGEWNDETRELAREMPIALVYNGTTHAVMMASPIDLCDFVLGFSFCEGIISKKDQIENVEIISTIKGIEIQIELTHAANTNFNRQRNLRLGPVGCGLCGIESLEAAIPKIARLESGTLFSPDQIIDGFKKLEGLQELGSKTWAVHAAAFMDTTGEVSLIREDIGRHNALDKLIGALLDDEIDASQGAILLTSRISIDLIQKAAAIKCPTICAISAPSSLALTAAKSAGMRLYAIVRKDGLEEY